MLLWLCSSQHVLSVYYCMWYQCYFIFIESYFNRLIVDDWRKSFSLLIVNKKDHAPRPPSRELMLPEFGFVILS